MLHLQLDNNANHDVRQLRMLKMSADTYLII